MVNSQGEATLLKTALYIDVLLGMAMLVMLTLTVTAEEKEKKEVHPQGRHHLRPSVR